MPNEREKVILIHPSGRRFTVFLTQYEISRAETDLHFLDEITEKYFRMYQNDILLGHTKEESSEDINITVEEIELEEPGLGSSTGNFHDNSNENILEDDYFQIHENDILPGLQDETTEETNNIALEEEIILEESEAGSSTENFQENLQVNISEGSSESTESNNISIWIIRGRENDDDKKATKYLLKLRAAERYIRKFDDKKTVKLQIWKQIAEEMCAAGFAVGAGRVGAKRCQQKFSNLYKTYVNFLKHVNQTGNNKKKTPEYYEEMHGILGGKDKIFPQFTFDSEDVLAGPSGLKSVSEMSDPGEGLAGSYGLISNSPSTSQSSTRNHIPERREDRNITEKITSLNTDKNISRDRLKHITTFRPNKNNEIISSIKAMQESFMKTNQEQFNKIIDVITEQNNLLREQNSQRDRLISLLAQDREKKRKYESDSDSD